MNKSYPEREEVTAVQQTQEAIKEKKSSFGEEQDERDGKAKKILNKVLGKNSCVGGGCFASITKLLSSKRKTAKIFVSKIGQQQQTVNEILTLFTLSS